MISIDAPLFTQIATAVREEYPGAFVTNEFVSKPPTFPAVFIEESDNTSDRSTMDSSNTELFANITLTVDIYSARNVGKKAECRAIAKYIDDMLIGLGCERSSLIPVPNLNEPTIYRMRGIYGYKVDAHSTIYRRG